MGWLIALGVLQLVALLYIAMQLERLNRAAIAASDLNIEHLQEVIGRLPN